MTWEKTNCEFINPYNFVPLKDRPVRKPVDSWRGELSGAVSCTLTLKTPLALPDHSKILDVEEKQPNEKHYTYDFMKLNEQPFIPASELRGMVRSVYEALTNSCMSVLDDEQLSARSSIIKNKAGILSWNKAAKTYILQPTEVLLVNTFAEKKKNYYQIFEDKRGRWIVDDRGNKCFNCQVVTIRNFRVSRPQSGRTGGGSAYSEPVQKGILLIGEVGKRTNAHYSRIFLLPQRNQRPFRLSREAVKNLEYLMKLYRNDKNNLCINSDHGWYAGYEVPPEGSDLQIPVFYDQANGADNYYLSPAMITRDVFYRKVRTAAREYTPCTGKDGTVCEACSVFGMVGDDHSYGSAVRFTDGLWSGDAEPQYEEATLRELASPKISSAEFYTIPPKIEPDVRKDMWNFDYYVKTQAGKNGKQIKTYHNNETRLRGRKFYLHREGVGKKTYEAPEKDGKPEQTERNITTMLLPKGQFTFRVCFDGISEEALRDLLTALAPIAQREGTGEKEVLWHKLGNGKPLGLGSVEVTLDRLELRSVVGDNLQYSVKTERISDYQSVLTEDSADRKALIYALSRKTTAVGNARFGYPMGRMKNPKDANDSGTHIWFMANRQIHGTGVQPIVKYTLPRLAQDDLTLPELQEGSSGYGNQNGNGNQGNKPNQNSGSWKSGKNNRSFSGGRPENKGKH